MSKSPKTLYDLCTMLRAEVNGASLQIHTVKVKPLGDTGWTAEYQAEGHRQEEYAAQFAKLVAGMQASLYLQK